MSKELTRDQMYIVQLTNKKLVMSKVCDDMKFNKREASLMMAGYQQAIDFLCKLMDEE